jgi:tripartite-type tricarboxylate transporter receptor subunit TctC
MKRGIAGVVTVLILFSSLSFSVAEGAERFPVRPITYVVPLEAGAGGDIGARPIVAKASALIGQPIVVVNKPGAGSTIGYREVYSSKPNGYTIGLGTSTLVTNKLQGLLPFDYRDFTLMGTYANWIAVVISSNKTKTPFKTFEELVAQSKARPGEVALAASGVGQFWWIAAMAFMETVGVKFNVIPQEGTGGFTVAQVAGGHADLAIVDLAAAKSQIEAGNVIPLAVFGSKRIPGKLESVRTLKELGYEINVSTTHVVIGPPKMPKDVSDKIAKVFEAAANDPEYQKFLIERNAIPGYMPPDQALRHYDEQRKVYRIVMEKAGILKEK